MEHVSGQEMGHAWPNLKYPQREQLARDLVDIYDQLYRLKSPGIGGIYHSVSTMDDRNLSRSPRWAPLSTESLNMLRAYCNLSIKDGYKLGPLQDVSLINYLMKAPPPSQTLPISTSEDYVELVSYHGNPSTRPQLDMPTYEKCVELFKSIFSLYAHSDVLGQSSDANNFCFSHGDLHAGNIFIDPQTGAITGLIDWECAAVSDPLLDVACILSYHESARPYASLLLQHSGLEDITSRQLAAAVWLFDLHTYLWYRERRLRRSATEAEREAEDQLAERLPRTLEDWRLGTS